MKFIFETKQGNIKIKIKKKTYSVPVQKKNKNKRRCEKSISFTEDSEKTVTNLPTNFMIYLDTKRQLPTNGFLSLVVNLIEEKPIKYIFRAYIRKHKKKTRQHKNTKNKTQNVILI